MTDAKQEARYTEAYSLLRELRAEKQFTQAELAGRLAKPQSFVSKYESGERRLDVAELMAVCDALEVTLLEFARALGARVS